MDTRIIFHFTDEGPVGIAFVQLGPRATMNGYGFNADILQHEGNIDDIFVVFIPSEPCFYGDRKAGGTGNGLGISIISGILFNMPAPAPRWAILLTGHP